jgi:hypothetical protein
MVLIREEMRAGLATPGIISVRVDNGTEWLQLGMGTIKQIYYFMSLFSVRNRIASIWRDFLMQIVVSKNELTEKESDSIK